MKLTEYIHQKEQFEKKGFELPGYDREAVKANTAEAPVWLHFGAGNIFRAFVANIQQDLLNAGEAQCGIIAAEGFDYEIIDRAYAPYDSLSLLSILRADGNVNHKVIGSVTEAIKADPSCADWDRLETIMMKKSLQMASFTITEKGYAMTSDDSMMGKLTKLLLVRYQNGAFPIALVSMDNCSHNGEKIENAVLAVAQRWLEAGIVEAGFLTYLKDRSKVTFPWSMIDKITPRPDAKVVKMLEEAGFEDTEIIVTGRNSYTAPFVNAEQAEYLVIEDDFPNGRPALEKAGVYMTDREHVNRVERMKVCTCLNPLHTALAIFGCILGKETIAQEMDDEDLKKMVYTLGYEEGMPVVTDPEILSPMSFIEDVLTLRLPNPFMPDTPQRIATDTSQKLSIRFGETIKAYMESETLDPKSLKVIPMVLAGWFRYLTGIGDDGKEFAISPDPLLEQVRTMMETAEAMAVERLHDASIFGVDIYEAGLADKVLASLHNMLQGPGAVRKELQRILK